MLTTVKGTYRSGTIELAEDPGVVGDVEVVVTFLGPSHGEEATPPRIMTSGLLATPGKPMSAIDDFKSAEFDDSGWNRD